MHGEAGIGYAPPRAAVSRPTATESVQTDEGWVVVAYDGRVRRPGQLSPRSILANEFLRHYGDTSLAGAVSRTVRNVDGVYSLLLLVDGTVVAFRDSSGLRPLCLGRLRDGYVVASESAAIDVVGGELLRSLRPGECVVVDPGARRYRSHQFVEGTLLLCPMEVAFVSRRDSVVDGRTVDEIRGEVGQRLATSATTDSECVVPACERSLSFAHGFAGATGAVVHHALQRHHGSAAGDPRPSAGDGDTCRRPNVIAEPLRDRSVTVVSAHYRPGLRGVVDELAAVADEVHLRLGSPPNVWQQFGAELLGADACDPDCAAELRRTDARTVRWLSAAAFLDVLGHPTERRPVRVASSG